MTKRVCPCSRKEPLAGKRADATFASKACQVRWMRENPGVQLSYRKAVEEIAYRLAIVLGLDVEDAFSIAEGWLRPAASDRQRALLEERQTTEGRKAA